MTSALETFLSTPPGGWGETRQARQRLFDAIYETQPGHTQRSNVARALEALVDAALAAGWGHHPDRGSR